MTATKQLEKIPVYDFSSRELYNDAYTHLFGRGERFLHLFGSAGSGKSNFAFQREIVESYEPRRRNRKTMVVRQTFNTLKDSCYADLKSVIYDWSLENDFDILKSPLSLTNKITNVEFIFRGLDDVEKIKSVKGVDRIIVEEATEVENRNDLDQLSLRLRGFDNPKPQITLNYNPVDEYHWLNTEFHQENVDDHYLLHTTYKDNRFLDDAYIKYLESLAEKNPNYHRVYVLGLWGRVLEGLIYDSYEIVDELPEVQFYGLDFGFSDPTALVAMGVQDALPKKNLICREELYENGLDANALIKRFGEVGVRKDLKIIGDCSRPEMIKALKDAGYKVEPSEKGAGSVLTGINRLRNYNIQIVAGSKNGIKEIQNYQKKEVHGKWFEDPAPNQVDHFLDAARYGEQAARIQKWEVIQRPTR